MSFPQRGSNPASVKGSTTAGQVLSVSLAQGWTASAVQWLRDGVAIPGATGNTYTTKQNDQGHNITYSLT
ncbi:hypothetical protein ACSFCC_11630, partial [Glaesserella parasuis]